MRFFLKVPYEKEKNFLSHISCVKSFCWSSIVKYIIKYIIKLVISDHLNNPNSWIPLSAFFRLDVRQIYIYKGIYVGEWAAMSIKSIYVSPRSSRVNQNSPCVKENIVSSIAISGNNMREIQSVKKSNF